MAKVISLPTAAADPVHNHRRAGSYGRKLVSLKAVRDRKRFNEAFQRGKGGLPPKQEGLQLPPLWAEKATLNLLEVEFLRLIRQMREALGDAS